MTQSINLENGFDFSNTEIGYAYLDEFHLRKAYALFRIINWPIIAKTGSKILANALKWHLPVEGLIKSTMYEHFCGGESLSQSLELAKKLESYNVKTVLDYAVEAKEKHEDFSKTEKEIVDGLNLADQNRELLPFVVFKMTGIVSFTLLYKKSQNQDFTPSEHSDWQKASARVEGIFAKAAQLGISILVDAEESWISPAIDHIVEKSMKTYNQKEVIIYHTLQMYRKDRIDYLKDLHRLAKDSGYKLGIKLVRGAYHEKEIARAKTLGYQIPVFEKKEDTDHSFDEAVRYCLSYPDEISVFLGTHNEASTRKAAQYIDQIGLPRNDKRLYFSQLFGMSDPLTFNLALHGFNVCKYVPYGPLKEAIPYLIRRAEENSSVAGQSSRELSLIYRELKRRQNQLKCC